MFPFCFLLLLLLHIVCIVRYSSILERTPLQLGSGSDMSSRLPPPSPSIRRSSTQDIQPRHRRSGTFDPPDLSRDHTPLNTRDDVRYSRDTPTYSREGSRDLYSRDGSVYGTRDGGVPNYSRDGSGTNYSREGSVYGGREGAGTNYSRYSSILDDKHNWGFSTLRRRNSKSSF